METRVTAVWRSYWCEASNMRVSAIFEYETNDREREREREREGGKRIIQSHTILISSFIRITSHPHIPHSFHASRLISSLPISLSTSLAHHCLTPFTVTGAFGFVAHPC